MNKLLSFVIPRKNLLSRLDVSFYHSPLVDEFLDICNKKKIELINFGKYIEKMKRYPNFYNIPYVPEGVPCLRVESVDMDGDIDYKHIDYIPGIIHTQFPGTHLEENDMIMAVRGHTVGKVALIPKDLEGGNISPNLIRIKLKDIVPKFTKHFLLSKYGKAQIDRLKSGSLQYTITEPDIKSIKIPEISETRQEEIINSIKEYEELKLKYKKDYENHLLNLTQILKINIKIINEEIFSVNKSDIIDRIDCFSLSPQYKHLTNDLRKLKNHDLSSSKDLNIVKPMNKEKYKELAVKEFKYIEVKNASKLPNFIDGYSEDVLISLPSRARQIVKENDVLLPRPIGSSEKISIVPKDLDGHLCSTGFIVIRSKDYDEACLLALVLKSPFVQRQIFNLQSGCIQPEITPTDFKKVILPIPKDKKEGLINKFKEEMQLAEEANTAYLENKKKSREVFLEELFKVNN